MQETWKPVAGNYKGWPYEVSDMGRVRRVGGRVLNPSYSHDGYLHLGFRMDGKRKCARVHRLVAFSFIDDSPASGLEVNHKDGDKTNNIPGNLEWVTAKENQQHAFETGLRVLRKLGVYKRKLTVNQVRAARVLHFERGVTQRRLAKWFGVAADTMRQAIVGKTYPEAA